MCSVTLIIIIIIGNLREISEILELIEWFITTVLWKYSKMANAHAERHTENWRTANSEWQVNFLSQTPSFSNRLWIVLNSISINMLKLKHWINEISLAEQLVFIGSLLDRFSLSLVKSTASWDNNHNFYYSLSVSLVTRIELKLKTNKHWWTETNEWMEQRHKSINHCNQFNHSVGIFIPSEPFNNQTKQMDRNQC